MFRTVANLDGHCNPAAMPSQRGRANSDHLVVTERKGIAGTVILAGGELLGCDLFAAAGPCLFQSYYYFSSGVSFFQIPDSLRHFTQSVALVDDRYYLTGLHEIVHDGQVPFVRSREQRDQILA